VTSETCLQPFTGGTWLQIGRPGRQGNIGLRFAKQALQIETACVHGQLTAVVTRPKFARPVAIELDAVVVGIAQINRFAYPVIGCAFERDAGAQDTAQRGGQRRTCGVDDSGVIEPCSARRWRRATQALPGVQSDVMVVAASREKRRGNAAESPRRCMI